MLNYVIPFSQIDDSIEKRKSERGSKMIYALENEREREREEGRERERESEHGCKSPIYSLSKYSLY